MFLEIYRPCIAACYACATFCDRCAVACFEGNDPQAMTRCIGLVMDCAQLSRSAAAMMSRNSEFVDTICEACADVCSACAVECGHHNARQCRQCAEACAQCASLCRDMARQTQSAGMAFA